MMICFGSDVSVYFEGGVVPPAASMQNNIRFAAMDAIRTKMLKVKEFPKLNFLL